jgi:cytoskeletal protein RodZ
MESNDNKIKNLMNENQQQLPPELNWEEMREGIFEKIHSIEVENLSLKKEKDSKRRILFFMLFVLGAGLGLFSILSAINKEKIVKESVVNQTPLSNLSSDMSIQSSPMSRDNVAEYGSESKENIKSNTKSEINESGTMQLRSEDNYLVYESVDATNNSGGINEKTVTRKNVSNKSVETNPMSGYSQSFDLVNQKTDKNYSDHRMSSPAKSEAKTSGEFQNTDVTIGVTNSQYYGEAISDQTFPESGIKPSSTQTEATTTNNKIFIENLFTPSLFVVSQSAANNLGVSISREHPKSNVDSSNKLADQFILEGGISFWKRGYGSTIPENGKYEKTLPSFQIQGNYVRYLKKSYFIMAGLQYQQLQSRFEYNQILQNYNITLKDTIIHVLNNSFTGSQNTIRGDVELTVPAERRVIHYNTSHLVKSTIALGRSWRFNAWQADLYLGGGINALVHNQGRALHQGDIIDYYGTSNPVFQNKWAFDAIVGTRLQYFVEQNLGITFGLQYQKSLVNWSLVNAENSFPSIIGLHLGLSYSWD